MKTPLIDKDELLPAVTFVLAVVLATYLTACGTVTMNQAEKIRATEARAAAELAIKERAAAEQAMAASVEAEKQAAVARARVAWVEAERKAAVERARAARAEADRPAAEEQKRANDKPQRPPTQPKPSAEPISSLESYSVTVSANEQLSMPGLPGELRVWIGRSSKAPINQPRMSTETVELGTINNWGQSKILKVWQTRHNRLQLLLYQTPETAIQKIVTGRPKFYSDPNYHYFIRVTLAIPINGVEEGFLWGGWVSLSKQSYEDYIETYNDSEIDSQYFGWFCNYLPYYKNTYALATNVYPQANGQRPYIELQESDNELYRDFINGISIAKAQDIAELCMHG